VGGFPGAAAGEQLAQSGGAARSCSRIGRREAPAEAQRRFCSRISAEDLQAIQSIFGLDTFFVTETVPYGEGAIFKGNLRGEAEVVVPLLLEKAQRSRLGSRYQLFLVEDAVRKAGGGGLAG
jgi:hypothetical protein